jgi:phospholipid/cholesterol/gamma-HCH transport system substrate-binding protein
LASRDRTPRSRQQLRDERGSTVARVAAVLGVVAAVVIVAVLMFGGGNNYTVNAVFENAGQLVKGNQVQIGGRVVGTVSDIELTDNADAKVKLDLDSDVKPLHEGTTAVVRVNSLSGIASRYISIKPGPNDAGEIDDGGEIVADDTRAPVDLDELFDTLDPETRKGLQKVVQGSARQLRDKGDLANESLKYLNPALSSTSRVAQELVLDQGVLERFVVDTSKLVTAVAERRDDLADLVGNANATAGAIASESAALDEALRLLPTTLRRGNTTFVNLRATLDDLDKLVAESKPATKELAPFFRKLRPLVDDATPTIRDLRLLIRRSGPNNDLIELNQKTPKLANIASTTFPRSIRALQRAQPVIEYARPYAPDLTGWLTKFAEGAAFYDANGHYARIQPLFNAFSLSDSPAGPVFTAQPFSQRLAGLETRQSQRCPGGATQYPPDGSAPFRDASGTLDCDPNAGLPGP